MYSAIDNIHLFNLFEELKIFSKIHNEFKRDMIKFYGDFTNVWLCFMGWFENRRWNYLWIRKHTISAPSKLYLIICSVYVYNIFIETLTLTECTA